MAMPRINEATDMDPCLIHAEPAPYLIRGTSLKVIERLQYLGWMRGDALLYDLSAGVCLEPKVVINGIENDCCLNFR